MSQPSRWIFTFLNGKSDGAKEMKALLGGKGANLCEMAKHGRNGGGVRHGQAMRVPFLSAPGRKTL